MNSENIMIELCLEIKMWNPLTPRPWAPVLYTLQKAKYYRVWLNCYKVGESTLIRMHHVKKKTIDDITIGLLESYTY